MATSLTPVFGDWIEWTGGRCPVDRGTIIQPHFRMRTREQAEQADTTHAGDWHWSHANRRSDIIAYRVVSA